MNREPLVASLPVQQRTEASKYAKHMERLQKVKPSVDNGPPRRFISADVRNGKRQMQRQERRFEIEHANAILLDKMQRIVDLGTTASNSGIIHAEEPELTSLNSHVRRQDLERITRENRGIVRRIQASHSNYDLNKWEEQRKKEEAALRRLARKPRTIDNSSLLMSSGIAYACNPYGTSPSRHKVPRQLPSLATNLGRNAIQYQQELVEHVSPQSLTPLPSIAPAEPSAREEVPADGNAVAPGEASSPRASTLDDAGHAPLAEGAETEAVSAPAGTAPRSSPGSADEDAPPADGQPEPAEQGPAEEMTVTVDPELVGAMEAEMEATAKAVSAIRAAVTTEALDLQAEIGPAAAASAQAVAAIKVKAGCTDAEMEEMIEAEVAATANAVAAIQAAATEDGAGCASAAGADNGVGEVDPTAPQPDPELVAAMSAEMAATAEAVAAIQAAVGIEAAAEAREALEAGGD